MLELLHEPAPAVAATGELTPQLLWVRVGTSPDTGTWVQWEPTARAIRYRRTYLDPEASFAAGTLVLRTVAAVLYPPTEGWRQLWQELELHHGWQQPRDDGSAQSRDGSGWAVQVHRGARSWAARGEIGCSGFESWRRAVSRLVGDRPVS
ncbi:MAG: hypothetical protein M3O70_15320 [Actinomycetota bacterium]|nr:hypothetical protein [Actinomycetota bacterium]